MRLTDRQKAVPDGVKIDAGGNGHGYCWIYAPVSLKHPKIRSINIRIRKIYDWTGIRIPAAGFSLRSESILPRGWNSTSGRRCWQAANGQSRRVPSIPWGWTAPLGVMAALKSVRIAAVDGLEAAFSKLIPDLLPIMESQDAMEGVMSFIERREAEFKGK